MLGTSLAKYVVPAVNFEDRPASCRPYIVVLHYTGMETAERACDWLCKEESRVSCHYLVDEAGGITQMVSEDKRAWHAGVSSWYGVIDINSHSIGIEIQNPGHNAGYPDFPHVQMLAVAALARDIMARWGIDGSNVLAHSDVAPGRKIDPGEKFDWHFLHRHGVGHWVRAEPVGKVGGHDLDITDFQSRLKSYGYGIEVTGITDEQTRRAIDAFQRHFRPARVDGKPDLSTYLTLVRLTEDWQVNHPVVAATPLK
jgi:N-acetylmuramoyl-L-alanine amidase